MQQPSPSAPSSNHLVPPLPPSVDPSGVHMVFDEMLDR
jgi:hypothetical protein